MCGYISGIFTKTLQFEVMKQPAPERVTKMLQILTTRGRQAFRIFCKVLRDVGEIELGYLLMKSAYRKENEAFV